MNENMIETEIIKILTQKSNPIRTTVIVKRTRENHLKELGFSNATIYRKIGKLKNQKKILEIGDSEYKRYGIEDPDKRAKYLILPEFNERAQHIDEILKFLKNGDNSDAISVFDELDRYTPRYHLTPSQLDKIVSVLKQDSDVVQRAIWILHRHITSFRIAPTNKKSLLENTKRILEKIDSNPENLTIQRDCLEILGMWNDPYIVEQLKKDASELAKLQKVKNYYESHYVAKVIEKERDSLFHFVRQLRKLQADPEINKNNRAIADIVKDIQSHATNFVIYPQEDSEHYTTI
jgi:hypothetical protein